MATPKIPGAGTIDKVRKATDKEAIFSALKIMASRPEYYSEAAPLVKDELEKKDLSVMDMTDEELVIVKTAIKTITEHGYVHPKIGVTLRMLSKKSSNDE